MATVLNNDEAIISGSAFSLHDLDGLLSALTSCISEFRTINTKLDNATDVFLKKIENEISLKATESTPSSKSLNASTTESESRNDALLTDQNAIDLLEDAINKIPQHLDADIRRITISPDVRRIVSDNSNKATDEALAQNAEICVRVDEQYSLPDTQSRPTHHENGGISASPDPAIPYSVEDGVIHLRPSKAQWTCFQKVLENAKLYGGAEIGAFKVILPDIGLLKEPTSHAKSFSYKVQMQRSGISRIDLIPSTFHSSPDWQEDTTGMTTSTVVSKFEQLIKQKSGLDNARYCTDINARTDHDRKRLGFPDSPIWPLAGNKLSETKARVPGLHWPYAYEASSCFGAAFAMHREDWDLYSVNYLYKGTKFWFIIPPSAADVLEQKVREEASGKFGNCAQFIRHSALFVPSDVLKRWQIPYKVIRQNAGEAIVTFPRAYHQGFSAGISLAEAVNYADADWNPVTYGVCNPRTCPKGFIGREMMEIRGNNEEQWSGDEKGDNETIYTLQESPINIEDTEPIPSKRGPNAKVIKKRKAEKILPESEKRSSKSPHQKNISRDANKVTRLDRTEVTKAFEHVASVLTTDPSAIFQEFLNRGSELDTDFDANRALLLTRLFYAIASPDSISQLRDACHSIRQNATNFNPSTDGIENTVKALDCLEATGHVISIWRRYCLVSLSTRRFEIRTKLSIGQRTRGQALQEITSDAVFGRADTQALIEMMAEAYPHLPACRNCKANANNEYVKKLRALKERILCGHKWSKLTDAFAPGILALVPTHGEYQTSNREFERLPIAAISALVEVLNNYRGQFLREISQSVSIYTSNFARDNNHSQRFLFEDHDPIKLRAEKYDSTNLIELCRVEPIRSDSTA